MGGNIYRRERFTLILSTQWNNSPAFIQNKEWKIHVVMILQIIDNESIVDLIEC